MGYCKNCGSIVSDAAVFCGVCGSPVERAEPEPTQLSYGEVPSLYGPPPMYDNNYNRARTDGPTVDNMAAINPNTTHSGLLGVVQGVMACMIAVLGLFAPILRSSVIITGSAAASVSVSMPVLFSLAMQLGDAMEGVSSGLGQSDESWRIYVYWIVALCIVGLIGLVGAFMTAARQFERTGKGTLVTGWLTAPYAILQVITLMYAVSSVRDATSNSMTALTGSGLSVSMTLWPWVMLVLSIASGVIGVIIKVQQPKAPRMNMYGG